MSVNTMNVLILVAGGEPGTHQPLTYVGGTRRQLLKRAAQLLFRSPLCACLEQCTKQGGYTTCCFLPALGVIQSPTLLQEVGFLSSV